MEQTIAGNDNMKSVITLYVSNKSCASNWCKDVDVYNCFKAFH